MRAMWLRSAAVSLAATATLAACAADKSAEPYGTLSVDQVDQLVGKPDVVIVDANPDDVYRKSHVPGAIWWRSAPLAQLLPADKGRTLVFYCASPS